MTANLVENESKTFLQGQVKCSYTWTITDYEDRVSSDVDCQESDSFEFVEPDGRILKWRLLMYPKSTSECNDDHGHIFLESLNDVKVRVGFMLSILDVPTKTELTFFSSAGFA